MSSKFDSRCPKRLESSPESFCDLAVLRLKAIRNAGKELTEKEEAALPGCPYAINHQYSNYCFFKYISEFSKPAALSDTEIASLLNISVEEVRRVEKSALSKMRMNSVLQEVKNAYGDDEIITAREVESDYKVIK